jgi:hypothetical protein
MNSRLAQLVDATCHSPYEVQRVCEVLTTMGVLDIISLTSLNADSLEAGIRAQGLVDEIWVSVHTLRVRDAACAEAARVAKVAHRIPMRRKASGDEESADDSLHDGSGLDAVEDEVKRMRLQ